MNFKTHAQSVLSNSGYRLTSPRKKVLEILSSTTKAVNPYKIVEVDSSLDPSTVYRILEVFQNLKLIHFVKDQQGYLPCSHFECDKEAHCHHQFICSNCKKIEEIHLDDSGFIQKIASKYKNLKIKNHYFEFSGTCQNCK